MVPGALQVLMHDLERTHGIKDTMLQERKGGRAPERIPTHAALGGMQAGNNGSAPHISLKQRQMAIYEWGPGGPRQPCHAGRIRLIALADVLSTARAALFSTP